MKKHSLLDFVSVFIFICLPGQLLYSQPKPRYWQTADGLPTTEVRQIIALPNHQMLVNCEGVFCISNGAGFSVVPCDRRKSYKLEHFADSVGYGFQWQGDSLLWLRDFYRIYLFDARTRSFRYDIDSRLASLGEFHSSPTAVTDWQGGTWTGTLGNGIAYTPPQRQMAERLEDDPLIGFVRGTAEVNVRLGDGRLLQRRGLNRIGYFTPETNHFDTLNLRLPQLNAFRNIVGACAVDDSWVVLYTQNGACLLDTQADTLAAFKAAEFIGEYSDKYNCMLRDTKGNLWVGTQNGLFGLTPDPSPVGEGNFAKEGSDYLCERVEGLANNCIRSLVDDSLGNIWVGTASGISKIANNQKPTANNQNYMVVNYSEDDGIPPVSMMERAACLTDDGRLVFVHHSTTATVFRPEWLQPDTTAYPVVLTAYSVNGHRMIPDGSPLILSHEHNTLSFQFSALNYASPQHMHYRYRLEGIEQEYKEGESLRREVEYRALPHGDYTFQVQARTDDGEWGPLTEMAVEILPPWWLTWWAKLLYGLIGLMVGIGLINYYLKRKRAALERENNERVNRLFELRDKARRQFAENTAIDASKISANVEEEELVKRMLAAINKNLDNEDYGVDQLARDVAMSRSSLYDKLRTMLGISPADFIRNVRLKHAAQLLTTTPLSIAEIAEQVGFNSPRIFSSNFKKMFGVLPSDYRSPKDVVSY